MTSRDFCYWLQGFFEISKADGNKLYITSEQTDVIQKHLNMVFYHEIDHNHGNEEHQEKLNAIHNATSPNTCESGTRVHTKAKFQDQIYIPPHSLTAEPEQLEFDFMKTKPGKNAVTYRC